ncbi:MAG TPA: hypothetical protein VF121_07220, partial [Thermoanaerobaculia bacterium]|nr:hypothetical protein [Thermoanaerobaculia bacterium]
MTNDERTEERLIEEALAALEEGLPSEGEPRAESPRDADAETLGRLYAEVLGLVAYDAPPLVPSPELRDRVLALVRGDETLEIEPGGPRAAELRTPPAQYPAPLPVPPPTFGQ